MAPKDKKHSAKNIEKLLKSPEAQRILDHCHSCKYCNQLNQALGWLIEKHMEETEDKEKLV